MISEKVKNTYESFKKRISAFENSSKFYKLDESWLSISILDGITYTLRGNKNLDSDLDFIVKGCAAYLAIIAHSCWSLLDVEVMVDDQAEGILIGARNGNNIPQDQEVVFYIERDVREFLIKLPYPFPVVGEFSRNINSLSCFFHLYAIGLFTGHSPHADGVWKDMKIQQLDSNISKVVKYLAQTCADSYERLFPDEKIGQVSELYLNSLIFPPLLYSENVTARRAIDGVLKFCKEYNVTKSQLLKLSNNFSQVFDETISMTGIAIYSALIDDNYSFSVLSRTYSYGAFIGTLRPGMYDVRKNFNEENDWLMLETLDEHYLNNISKELAFSYLPWVKINAQRIVTSYQDSNFRLLMQALSIMDLKVSIQYCDKILDDDPNDIDVKIQRIYLEIINADLDGAEKLARELLSDPNSEGNFEVYNIVGLVSLAKYQIDSAINYFNQARSFHTGDKLKLSEINNNYAWSLMCSNKYEEALNSLDFALMRHPDNILALLNKHSCLFELKKYAESAKIRQKLVSLAPYDSRVVSISFYSLLET
ncbi:MAG: hypothetical protein KBC84_04005 [Proteobacteria bacterium]|nr:hypothetical protein [Pseudomonadota bacterium]